MTRYLLTRRVLRLGGEFPVSHTIALTCDSSADSAAVRSLRRRYRIEWVRTSDRDAMRRWRDAVIATLTPVPARRLASTLLRYTFPDAIDKLTIENGVAIHGAE